MQTHHLSFTTHTTLTHQIHLHTPHYSSSKHLANDTMTQPLVGFLFFTFWHTSPQTTSHTSQVSHLVLSHSHFTSHMTSDHTYQKSLIHLTLYITSLHPHLSLGVLWHTQHPISTSLKIENTIIFFFTCKRW